MRASVQREAGYRLHRLGVSAPCPARASLESARQLSAGPPRSPRRRKRAEGFRLDDGMTRVVGLLLVALGLAACTAPRSGGPAHTPASIGDLALEAGSVSVAAPGASGTSGIQHDAEVAPEDAAEAPPPAPEGPCLPLHTIEGMSGHFSVPCSYIANTKPGQWYGLPSLGATYVHLGHGKSLEALTATQTFFGRVELGVGFNNLDVGDLYEDIGTATGVRPDGHRVRLWNFNARFMVLKENDWDQAWLPALTAGVSYKYNQDWRDLDRDMKAVAPGGLKDIAGLEDNDGWDFHAYATKTLMIGGMPFIATVGGRFTESAQLGLLGFTGEYTFNIEAAVCAMVTSEIVLAAEYRQKPNDYDEVPGLLADEDDWWVLAVAWLPTDKLSLALGYGHFGEVTNHTANRSVGVAIKYEF